MRVPTLCSSEVPTRECEPESERVELCEGFIAYHVTGGVDEYHSGSSGSWIVISRAIAVAQNAGFHSNTHISSGQNVL